MCNGKKCEKLHRRQESNIEASFMKTIYKTCAVQCTKSESMVEMIMKHISTAFQTTA